MPRLLIRSVEFEGPYYEMWPPPSHRNIFVDFERKNDKQAWARKIVHDFATRAYRRPITPPKESALMAVYAKVAGKRTQLPGSREGHAAGGPDLAAVPLPGRDQQQPCGPSRSTISNWLRSSPTFCGTGRRIAGLCNWPPPDCSRSNSIPKWTA